MTVFVSYSSRDRETVKSLTQDLRDADEQVWMDQRLAGGDPWWRAILEQIRGCDVFIFALSQNSIDSKPCQSELKYVQALGLPILPVQVGPVDSMQLNPLATVQAIDYRHPTPSTAMRLSAGLHRERARRQPLPEPLPDEPPMPFEYLIRLYTIVAGPDQLSPPDQAAMVAQLRVGLREDGQHEAARNDIVMLLGKLRDREDVTYRTRTDVDALLASIDAESRPQSPIATDTTAQAERQLDHSMSPVSTPRPTDANHEPAEEDRTTLDHPPSDIDLRAERDDDRVNATAPANELNSSQALRESLEMPFVSSPETTARPLATRPPLQRLNRRTKIMVASVAAVAVAVAAVIVAIILGSRSSLIGGSVSPTSSAAAASGASSATGSASLGPGRAKVMIDGQAHDVTGQQVVCATVGDRVNITIGDATTGIGAVLSDANPPVVESVALDHPNGVGLAYAQGEGGGNAEATEDANSYTITGTATGVDISNPMEPVHKSFEIDVTCP